MDTSTPLRSNKSSLDFDFGKIGNSDTSIPLSPIRKLNQDDSKSGDIVEESDAPDELDHSRDRSSISSNVLKPKNPVFQRILTSTPNTKKDLMNRANRQRSSFSSKASHRSDSYMSYNSKDSLGSLSNPITLSESSDDDVPVQRKGNVIVPNSDDEVQRSRESEVIDLDSEDDDEENAPKEHVIVSDSDEDVAVVGSTRRRVVISDDEENDAVFNNSAVSGSVEDVVIESSANSSTSNKSGAIYIDSSDDSIKNDVVHRNKDIVIDTTRESVGESSDESELEDDDVAVPKNYVFTNEEKNSLKAFPRDRLESDLKRFKSTNLKALPDGGEKIRRRIALIEDRLATMVEQEVHIVKVKKPSLDPVVLDKYLDEGKRMFGGAMTKERQETIAKVTEEALERIHTAITEAPEDVPTETPSGINIDLMGHQKQGLTWMLFRETKNPRGGILADDMGLGKTLSMISLIVAQKNSRKDSEEVKKMRQQLMIKHFQNDKEVTPAFCTLIVAPASLIYQWEKEIKDRVEPHKLKVYVFHGPKRETDPRALSRFDIVLTTYNIISSELGVSAKDDDESDDSDGGRVKNKVKQKRCISKSNKSVLTKLGWERIILDEAHNIKNRQSLASKGCCRIPALCRWALTGTPIHNNLWDLFSLVKFLRVHPFGEEKMWKEFIVQGGRAGGERINALVKSLLLRRTKTQICNITNKPLVDLKPRTFEVVKVELKNLEYNIYQQMFEASKQKAKQLIELHADMPIRRKKKVGNVVKNPFLAGAREIDLDDKFQSMNAILMLLLRLRQACVHMSLTRAAVDLDAFKADGADESAYMDDLEKTFGNISLSDKDYEMDDNGKKCTVETVFSTSYKSAKIRALFDRLDNVFESNDKCVIVSQWTSMLDIIEQHLKKKKVSYTSITGKILTKDRQERVNSFNERKGGAQVMLLSLTAGGVGLNLVGGNHLFLVDLHWNPALEQQACDRIYRVGQTKDVFIHKFITNDTIEQRVLELQEKKKELAKGVLEGSAKIPSKLSINDLKHLFDLNHREPVKPKTTYQGPNNVRHLP